MWINKQLNTIFDILNNEYEELNTAWIRMHVYPNFRWQKCRSQAPLAAIHFRKLRKNSSLMSFTDWKMVLSGASVQRIHSTCWIIHMFPLLMSPIFKEKWISLWNCFVDGVEYIQHMCVFVHFISGQIVIRCRQESLCAAIWLILCDLQKGQEWLFPN